MTVTLDWLGCATFRLTVDDLVIFDAVVKAEFINFGVFAPLPCTVYLV